MSDKPKYSDVKCGICGTCWTEHTSEHCPHGRPPKSDKPTPVIVTNNPKEPS